MNLLIISPAYAPFCGVGANRMVSLTTYLRDMGENVTVMRDSPVSISTELASAEVPGGIRYVDVNVAGNFSHMENEYEQAIKDLLAREKFDLAIVSAGPFYTLKVSAKLNSTYNLKYILEFRDLWIYEERRRDSLIKDIKRLILRMPHIIKERKAVELASNIVVVTQGDEERIKRFYPLKADDVKLIMNGYDDSRMKKVECRYNFNNAIYIGIFGKFAYYSLKYAQQLVAGIKELIKNGYNIKILHIGESEEAEKILSTVGFPVEHYINTGSMDYAMGIECLRNVRICAFVYAARTGLGTKIFDYVYLNKPVVLVSSPKGALSQFVTSFENGYVCQNSKEIVTTVQRLIDQDICYLDNKARIEVYARSVQNKKYYELIKKIRNKNEEDKV